VSDQLLVGQAVALDIEGASPPAQVIGVVLAMPPREILLSLASGAMAPAALQPGAQVIVSFATTMGLHRGRTAVLRVSPGNTVAVALARFAPVSTAQRRQFFRVSATLMVKLEVGPTRASSLPHEDARALTQDLSSGGMRVETTLVLSLGDRVKATVETPRGLRKYLPDHMTCEAEVVRVESVMRRNRKLCSAGLRFVFATESERDRWVQLTFDLQRGVQI
jgi:c-di-GMP-binding flagellar brake protein YcgR